MSLDFLMLVRVGGRRGGRERGDGRRCLFFFWGYGGENSCGIIREIGFWSTGFLDGKGFFEGGFGGADGLLREQRGMFRGDVMGSVGVVAVCFFDNWNAVK